MSLCKSDYCAKFGKTANKVLEKTDRKSIKIKAEENFHMRKKKPQSN